MPLGKRGQGKKPARERDRSPAGRARASYRVAEFGWSIVVPRNGRPREPAKVTRVRHERRGLVAARNLDLHSLPRAAGRWTRRGACWDERRCLVGPGRPSPWDRRSSRDGFTPPGGARSERSVALSTSPEGKRLGPRQDEPFTRFVGNGLDPQVTENHEGDEALSVQS